MRSFKAYIAESWKTPGLNPRHEHYRDHPDLPGMISKAYTPMGGYGKKPTGSEEERKAIHNDLHNPNHVLKVDTEHGKARAVLIFKKHPAGHKFIGGAVTKSSKEQRAKGLRSYLRGAGEAFKHKNAWIEAPWHPDPHHPANHAGVTGALQKIGQPIEPIPHEEMRKMLGKQIRPVEGHPHAYTRTIGNKEVAKIGFRAKQS